MLCNSQYCFNWTRTKLPFHTSSDRKLKLIEAPIITVTGKAYWDVGPCAQGSVEPEKPSSRLRCMGDSSGDETNSPVIRFYDVAGNVIETHEHAGEFKEW